ncbi:expressed unknown protein [Seminavis robusta]|uniref:Fe2OG dioxygenase domain-containing protein n=1 Tax=Seminavis robusta TaxID=568900 RepID=A0A9N8ETB2_9STRA|nr:expressed unknown protein [Seminavis robusta]|eukprot:Sro1628_g286950.1 n/a (327) ;mRNA; r:1006-2616
MMVDSMYSKLALIFLGLLLAAVHGMTETHRVEEHLKRYGGDWPPEYIPNTPGWKRQMDKRFKQVLEMDNRHKKYDGWMQTVNMAFLAPNFTEYGMGLVRAPEDLTLTLQHEIRTAIKDGKTRKEHSIDAIGGPNGCDFVDRPDLTQRVVTELQPYTEAWVGMPLHPVLAYGFRLYLNESDLNMHVDKAQTHIISMIYHIDRSEDSQPWPVLIEDFKGNTHEIELQPGDILFYESSKCLHGRPSKYYGSWYTSVFVHYYPTNGWMDTDHNMECHYAIPPWWDTEVPPQDKTQEPLDILGTSFKEHNCPNEWHRTRPSDACPKENDAG